MTQTQFSAALVSGQQRICNKGIIRPESWQMMNLRAHITRLGTGCGLAALALIPPVFAQDSPEAGQVVSDRAMTDRAMTDQTAVRLLSAVTATGDESVLPFGVEIALQPGWKTYWRSPGDAGFPPEVTIAGSENVAAAELDFPAPHRFELFGLQTFGYGEKVIFPLRVTPVTPGAALTLKAHLRYLVCEQICIPYEHDLTLSLPAGSPQLTPEAPLISDAEARVPDDGARARWRLSDVHVAGETLKVSAVSEGDVFMAPDLLVEAPSGLLFGKPVVMKSDGDRGVSFSVPIEGGKADEIAATALTLTLVDNAHGLEQEVVPNAFQGGGIAMSASPGFIWMLLVAWAGGLILNIMPCVLPVLVLKLTSVLEQAGAARRDLRGSFVASAAGIVTAFAALAAILIGLKLGGQGIGWGIQFQQPVFLGVLAGICVVFAANVWGLFQLRVPAFAGGIATAADAAEGRHPRRAAFLQGVLATVLATPCSAPLVGTAIGFALAQGPLEIALIFAAMGLGLATPYLAIAAFPGLVAWLPRPGRWMVWLKRLLGLSLLGTALWLVMVLGQQIGWWQKAATADSVKWTAFDESAIAAEVAKGRVVFVDVTAEWCLTCRANKEFVLKRDPVAAALNDSHVTPMLADWTNPDPAISAYLASFGRYGIPMNAVYGPGAPNGILLPELLDSDSVLDALKRAK